MSTGRVIVAIPFSKTKKARGFSPGLSISTCCQELWLVRFSYTVTDRAGTSRILIQQQAQGQQQFAVTEPKFSPSQCRKSIRRTPSPRTGEPRIPNRRTPHPEPRTLEPPVAYRCGRVRRDAHQKVKIRPESAPRARRGRGSWPGAHLGAGRTAAAPEEIPRSHPPGAEAGRAAAQQEGKGRGLRPGPETDGNHRRTGDSG